MENGENRGKRLLHACCGPCSLEPVRLLREAGVQPVLYYANSNIYPPEEYVRRRDTIRAWAFEQGIPFEEGAYEPQSWESTAGRLGDASVERYGVVMHEAQPLSAEDGKDNDGGESAEFEDQLEDPAERARQARCRACYRQRFQDAAAFAAANGFDELSTTLSVSPYQYTAIIRDELERACAAYDVKPVFNDYRPYYDAATRRSREEGMYRQNYCGCRFSQEEARIEREARKQMRAQARRVIQEQNAEARAQQERQLAQSRQEKQAYQLKQQRKRAILKALRESRPQ